MFHENESLSHACNVLQNRAGGARASPAVIWEHLQAMGRLCWPAGLRDVEDAVPYGAGFHSSAGGCEEVVQKFFVYGSKLLVEANSSVLFGFLALRGIGAASAVFTDIILSLDRNL